MKYAIHLIKNRAHKIPKNIKFWLYLIPMIIVLTSCSNNFLEESPKEVTEELFYNTAEEVEAAVNASYSPIRYIYAEQVAVLDAHTDWGYGRGSRANYNDFQGFNSANINVAGNRWNAFYQSIRNANLVIKNAPNSHDINPSEKELFVSEAKFIRALDYFILVRNWGGVPLRTDTNMETINIPKSEPSSVYDLILKDLIEAANNLPENARNIGRPTSYAAKTMLSEVYLTLDMYPEAEEVALEVMNSRVFSLVSASTIENLQYDLFGPDLLTSSEEIFYFKYARETDQGNYLVNILNHPATGLFSFGGAYAHYSDAANLFYVNWNNNDLRKGLWDQIDFGLGSTTLVSKKYIDQEAIGVRGAGNDLPVYRYADVLLLYAEASARATGTPTVEGIEALNKVHRRAYGQPIDSPSTFDYVIGDYTLDSFIDLVLQERAYEFIFEGKRWYDLKRTGKAAETILAIKGIEITEKHYLWPIPVSEIDYNEAISPEDQNPGY